MIKKNLTHLLAASLIATSPVLYAQDSNENPVENDMSTSIKLEQLDNLSLNNSTNTAYCLTEKPYKSKENLTNTTFNPSYCFLQKITMAQAYFTHKDGKEITRFETPNCLIEISDGRVSIMPRGLRVILALVDLVKNNESNPYLQYKN